MPVRGEEEGEGGEVEGEEGLEVVDSDPEAQVAAGAALAGRKLWHLRKILLNISD